jgi:5,10-methylenetetrahydrofolate reductase
MTPTEGSGGSARRLAGGAATVDCAACLRARPHLHGIKPMNDLRSKLADRSHWVRLYGTTPPREGSTDEVVQAAATKLYERIKDLPVDGTVVYDIQDESARTAAPRPFPFMRTVDPRGYSALLRSLTGKPAVTYKCIGQTNAAGWRAWLDQAAAEYGVELLSVVGRASSRGAAADALSLPEALAIAAAHPAGFALGGVTIAERHGGGESESRRMLEKARHGCSFFVSQAVYHAEPTVRMLTDYSRECREAGVKPSRVVLTFTPCGREKTMTFIKWLGIAMPKATERAILTAKSPLAMSIEICRANLREILAHEDYADVPLGVNVESVAINKDEIDASIDLFHSLEELVQQYRDAHGYHV